MLIGPWRHRCGTIGVDFGHHALKLLQLHPTHAGLRAAAAMRYALPSDIPREGQAYWDTMTELLIAARREGAFVGRRAVTCLPSDVVSYKNMRFPPMPAGDLQQAVEWEAPSRLGTTDQPMTIQYLDAGGVFQGEERRRELVVMGAATSYLESHLNMLQKAGLKPHAIEVPPVALARCLQHNPAHHGGDQAQVVLDVGQRASKVLIARRGTVRFFKMIDIGGAHFTEAVAKHLNLNEDEAAEQRWALPDPATAKNAADQAESQQRVHRLVYEALRPVVDELARELGLCLRYYSVTFRGHRPEQVSLVGGEARQAWLAPVLADTAGVEVTTIDPIDEVGCEPNEGVLEAAPHTEWAVAAGLSLRQAHEAAPTRSAA